MCDFKFEAHHSLEPMETFLRCAVAEPLSRPCVELVCDTIAVALRERCLAGGFLGDRAVPPLNPLLARQRSANAPRADGPVWLGMTGPKGTEGFLSTSLDGK